MPKTTLAPLKMKLFIERSRQVLNILGFETVILSVSNLHLSLSIKSMKERDRVTRYWCEWKP